MADTLAIGSVWEETARFCRREFALLAPVAAIGFGLPLVMLLLAVPGDQAEAGKIMPGPWMLWLLPGMALSMLGSLAISAMALRPGATVGECLRIAILRAPAGIGLFGLNLLFQVVIAMPVRVLSALGAAIGDGSGVLAMAGEVVVLAAMIWLFVRAMPIWAMLADRPMSPVAAVRGVLALTRGRYRALLLVRVIGAVAGVIAMLVTLVPLGAVFATIGMVTGGPQAAETLSYVASAAVFAALVTLWTVYVARLYARLVSISGI